MNHEMYGSEKTTNEEMLLIISLGFSFDVLKIKGMEFKILL